ncbi:MAG: LacI family DNA-binding transcriptional regulator [Paenibacillus sp.]|jgi:LacI family transcriptional regulator|uniref:LacI family DNA-binding transcriptional regulator n=1 Tax=Paenibacillus sp. TaxID=58172 RepID=UPI00290F9952|nr:LacI family DNA-binding transcriptional regulator [Paenibacillus sp.]MDU4698007.1 LacI family DNA-binding transcriptional regulator [Paenibacillus sp.]
MKIATIRDVALKAGVSPATVSRVITNKGNTTEEIKKRVLLAMEELKYVPNINAQSLSSNKSRTVCFSIARNPKEILGNAFFSDVLFGVSEAAKLQNYNLQFAFFHTIEEQMEKCLKLYRQKQADGFIFTSIRSADKDYLLNSMQVKQIPFVMIGNNLSHNVLSVHNDNVRDSYTATKYLLDKGYRQILFLTPNLKQDVIYDRIHGYQRAVEEKGIRPSSDYIIYSGDEEDEVMEALMQADQTGLPFDSIITMESIMSLSALKYCHIRGKKVPEEIGILCFNNAPYLDKVSPAISCIDLNPVLLGAEAFNLLLDRMENPADSFVNKGITLPSKIIERQTT